MQWGGNVVLCHNSLRDVFAQFCHRARLGGQLEVGHGSEALDLTVVCPLN